MTKIVQLHRMSSAQATLYVGPDGEVICDTGSHRLRVQDGVTPGGFGTLISNLNLGDIADPVAARNNLGAAPLISPSFTTPILGTPASGNLTNCTGYDMADLVGLGTGIATLLAGTANAVTTAFSEGTVAAAASVNLATSGLPRQSVTGNTTIAGFTGASSKFRLRITGTPLFTYNATSMITPTGTDYQAAPGDIVDVELDASNNTRITHIQPYGGCKESAVTGVGVATGATTMTSIALTPGKWRLTGNIQEQGGGAPANNYFVGGISTTSSSYAGTQYGKSKMLQAPGFDVGGGNPLGSIAFSGFEVTLTANTAYYLVANCRSNPDNFDGMIRAERIF